MTGFVLIVGLVLLTLAAICEGAELLKWLYEHDRRKQ